MRVGGRPHAWPEWDDEKFYEIAGSDTQTFLELFTMRTSSPSVRSSRPTTNVGACGRCHQIPRRRYLFFDYTSVIPRIDELFDVRPNVYGNSPRVMKLRDVRPSTVANRNYIMKYLRYVRSTVEHNGHQTVLSQIAKQTHRQCGGKMSLSRPSRG